MSHHSWFAAGTAAESAIMCQSGPGRRQRVYPSSTTEKSSRMGQFIKLCGILRNQQEIVRHPGADAAGPEGRKWLPEPGESQCGCATQLSRQTAMQAPAGQPRG